jgi:hypothetical protein
MADHEPRDAIRRIMFLYVRFQVLTAASMMFRIVFWDVLPCKMIVLPPSSGMRMMEAVRTSETSVANHFTRQYNPEDSSELDVTMLNHVHFSYQQ